VKLKFELITKGVMRNTSNGFASLNLASAGLDPGESLKMTVMFSTLQGGPADGGQLSFVIELQNGDLPPHDSDDDDNAGVTTRTSLSSSAGIASSASSVGRGSLTTLTARPSEIVVSSVTSPVAKPGTTPRSGRRQSTVVIPKWVDDDDVASTDRAIVPVPATIFVEDSSPAGTSCSANVPFENTLFESDSKNNKSARSEVVTQEPADLVTFTPETASTGDSSSALPATPKTPVSRRASRGHNIIVPRWNDDDHTVACTVPEPPTPPPPPPPASPLFAVADPVSPLPATVSVGKDYSTVDACDDDDDQVITTNKPSFGAHTVPISTSNARLLTTPATSASVSSVDVKPSVTMKSVSPAGKPPPPSAPRPTAAPQPKVRKGTGQRSVDKAVDSEIADRTTDVKGTVMSKLFGKTEVSEKQKVDVAPLAVVDAAAIETPSAPTRRLSIRRPSVQPYQLSSVTVKSEIKDQPTLTPPPLPPTPLPPTLSMVIASASTPTHIPAPISPVPLTPTVDLAALVVEAKEPLQRTIRLLEKTTTEQRELISSLNRRISEYEEEKQVICRNHEGVIEQMLTDRAMLAVNMDKLHEQMSKLAADRQEETESADQMILMLKAQVNDVESDVRRLKRENEEAGSLVTHLQVELEAKTSENASIQLNLVLAKAEIDALIEQRRAELAASDTDARQMLQRRLDGLQLDLDRMVVSHLAELDTTKVSFETKLAAMQDILDTKDKDISKLTADLDDARMQLLFQTAELEETSIIGQRQIRDLQETIDLQNQQIERWQITEARYKEQVESFQNEKGHDRANGGYHSQQVSLSSSEDISATNDSSLNRLETKLAKEVYEKRLLKSELSRLKVELAQQQRTNREQTSRAEELERTISTLLADATAQTKLIHEQQQMMTQQQQQYLQLQRLNLTTAASATRASFTAERRSISRGSFVYQGSSTLAPLTDQGMTVNSDDSGLGMDTVPGLDSRAGRGLGNDDAVRRRSSSNPVVSAIKILDEKESYKEVLASISLDCPGDDTKDGFKRLSIDVGLANKVASDDECSTGMGSLVDDCANVDVLRLDPLLPAPSLSARDEGVEELSRTSSIERFSPEVEVGSGGSGGYSLAGSGPGSSLAPKKMGSVRFATEETVENLSGAGVESETAVLNRHTSLSAMAQLFSAPDTTEPATPDMPNGSLPANASTTPMPSRTPTVTPRRSSRFFGPESPALLAIGAEAAALTSVTNSVPFSNIAGKSAAPAASLSGLFNNQPDLPNTGASPSAGPASSTLPPHLSVHAHAVQLAAASVPTTSKGLRESFTEESMKQMRRTPRQSVKYEQQQEQMLRREKMFHEEKQQQQVNKLEELHRQEVLALKKDIERLSKDLVNTKLQKSLGSLPRPPMLGDSSPMSSYLNSAREDAGGNDDLVDYLVDEIEQSSGSNEGFRRYLRRASTMAASAIDESATSKGGLLIDSAHVNAENCGGDVNDAGANSNALRKAAWLRGGSLARAGMDLPSQCQRKLIRSPNAQPYTQYFPLELTIRDYHRRVLDIVGCGIRDRVVFMHQAGSLRQMTSSGKGYTGYSPGVSPTKTSDFHNSSSVGESKSFTAAETVAFETLRLDTVGMLELLTAKQITADVQQKAIYAAVTRSLGLSNAEEYLSPSRTLLACNLQQLNMRVDSSRLSKLPILFDAAQTLLTCFAQATLSNNIFVKAALADLKELEEQLELHAAYKEQRMKILGWSWGTEDKGEWRNKMPSLASMDGRSLFASSKDGFELSSSTAVQQGPNYGEQAMLASALSNYLNHTPSGQLKGANSSNSLRKPSVRNGWIDVSSVFMPTAPVGVDASATMTAMQALSAPMPQGENFLVQLKRFVFSFAAPSDKEMEQVRGQIVSCVAQMELFLHPREMALSALVIRLALLSDFLYSKATFMSVRGDEVEAQRLQNLGNSLERTLEDQDAFDIEASTGSVESRDEFINRMTDVKVVDLSNFLSPAGTKMIGRQSVQSESEKLHTTDVINAARHRMTGRGRLEQVLKLEKQTTGLIERLTGAKQDAGNRNKFDEEEKIEQDLSKLVKLSESLKKITSQNFPMSLTEIERKLATNGTAFLTADFLFTAPHPDDGLSIGALVIQIGSRILLGRIVNLWPGLNVSTITHTPDQETISATRRSSMRRPSLAAGLRQSASDLEKHNASLVNIDFSDACSLRLAGFSFQQLRSSGKFSDAQILKAGCFSAKELRDVGFRVADLRGASYSVADCRLAGFDVAQVRAGGYDEPTIVKSGGYSLSQLKFANCDIQRHALMSLFESTNGKHWKKKHNW
jgi:hypothetical protein